MWLLRLNKTLHFIAIGYGPLFLIAAVIKFRRHMS